MTKVFGGSRTQTLK